jgi:hypothetical protein
VSAPAHSAGTDDGFTAFVDGLAAQLVEHSPTFEAFVVAMPGVMPDEALAALRRIPTPRAAQLAADATIDRAGPVIDQCHQLPLPHPLDSEFRFDSLTADILAAGLVEATRNGDEILLVGVPSVATSIASLNVDRRIRFLGPDNCVTAAVQAAIPDGQLMLEQGSGGTAAAALLDPPWYREPMRHLIGVCAHGCRPGALVNLVVPPIGTRPEIARDKEAFLSFAASAGLVPSSRGGPVCYRTPLFELAAMERQGIARLASWRRGECLEFAVTATGSRVPWIRPAATELSVGGVRLRLVHGARRGSGELVPLDSHEVHPSVSARSHGRDAATLWTTTNRAFVVDFDLAKAAMTEIADDPEMLLPGSSSPKNEPASDPDVARGANLIHQLSELIGRENADARRLVGDGAWRETVMEWRY